MKFTLKKVTSTTEFVYDNAAVHIERPKPVEK